VSTTKIWFRPDDTDFYGNATIDIQGNSSVSVVTETLQNTQPLANAYFNSFADEVGEGWIKTENYGGWRSPSTGLITTDPLGNPGAVNSHYLTYGVNGNPIYYANVSAKNFTIGNLSASLGAGTGKYIADETRLYFVTDYITDGYAADADNQYMVDDYFEETTAIPDYTFPGGNTLPGATGNVSVVGKWVKRYAYPTLGTQGSTFTEHYTDQGNTSVSTFSFVKFSTADTSPVYSNTEPTSYEITGNATTITAAETNTFNNELFFANVGVEADNTLFDEYAINVYIAYEYEWGVYYEVNLHSVTSSITSEFTVADTLAGMLFSGTADLEDSVSTTLTAQLDISAESSLDFSLDTAITGGLLHSGSSSISAELDIQSTTGVIIDCDALTLDIDCTVADTLANKTPGGSAELNTDTELTATGTLAIFAQSDLEQTTSVLADSSITRGGSTQLEAVANIPLAQPGFLITAGVITESSATVVIEQYVTGGTGVILGSSEADFSAESNLTLISGITQEAEATLSIETDVDIQLAGRLITVSQELDIAAELADVAAAITQTATASLSAAADAEIVAGYLIGIDLEIVQEINTDFDPTEARIFYIDEYYQVKVKPETRITKVSDQNSVLSVKSETRINTTLEETLGLVVKPETRQAEQAILPTTLVGTRLQRIPQ